MEQMAKSKGNRIRLLSPYKEHLAQAFAFLYTRVALPVPIPEIGKEKVQVRTGPKLIP
jgi:hypothetical protein